MYKKYIKRVLDIIFSVLFILLLSPVMLITLVCVAFSLGFPVIFKQKRPGLNNKEFTIYKFRSMVTETDLPDEKRITRVGAFIRRFYLDELPELFNILKGEMSFIGPRPQLIEDNLFFSSEISKRQSVRPGLTGLAQSMGEKALRWDIKFKYDLEYIENITFLNDIKIVFRTFGSVFEKKTIPPDMSTYGKWLTSEGLITQEEYNKVISEKKR